MFRAEFYHGWAWPKTPNAQHNLGLLGGFRMICERSGIGGFDPRYKSILGEGHSIEQHVDLCLEHGADILPCIDIHDNGDSTGTGYHGAAGNGRPPFLGEEELRRYCRELFSYLQNRGVTPKYVQFGNELDYSPQNEGDWSFYLDRLLYLALVVSQEVEEAFGDGVEVILGCTKAYRNSSRKTLVEACIDSGLEDLFILDIHGNGLSIEEVRDQISWMRMRNCRVAVLEDRNPGPHNDAYDRGRAFSEAGALIVGQFGSRNVNAFGDNPRGLWGVRPTGKKIRDTGAAWTFIGFLEDEFSRLVNLAEWCGSRRPGEILPDDTEGQEPNGGDDDAGYPYLGPLASMLRRTAHIAGAPKPVVEDLLNDPQWVVKAVNFVEKIK